MNESGLDAADDQNERAHGNSHQREGEVENPKHHHQRRRKSALHEQGPVHFCRQVRGGVGERPSHQVTPEDDRQQPDVQRQSHQRHRRQVSEEPKKRELRGDADQRVLRISRNRHARADIRGSGERNHVGLGREVQALRDSQNDGRKDQADGVVDKESGKHP